MGYRHYFYLVKKSEVDKIKDMTFDELFEYAKTCGAEFYEDENWFNWEDEKIFESIEVFEFGKLYWDDTAERIYNTGVHLFNDKKLQEYVDDYVPYVVGKEGLLEAIKIYQEKIVKYYTDLLTDGQDYNGPLGLTFRKEDVKSADKIIEHFTDKIRSLSYRDIANIDEGDRWSVTTSWEYEHSIFNLVHLLKTIDWEKETLLFYGW